MSSDNGFESWANNFRKAVEEIANGKAEEAPFGEILKSLNELFWNRFKKPSDIEEFKDENFFNKIAVLALSGASQLSGRSLNEMGKECYELGVRKNKDYGSDNILKFGTMGLIVRIGDKINRLNNLIRTKSQAVTDEKELDTLMDIFNYAVYGIMLSRNVWF